MMDYFIPADAWNNSSKSNGNKNRYSGINQQHRRAVTAGIVWFLAVGLSSCVRMDGLTF